MFDFIRYSKDKNALAALMEKDACYRSVEQDAFDVMAHYGDAQELIKVKDYYMKEGKVDMSSAITLLIAEGRMEGRAEGYDEKTRMIVRNMLSRNIPIQNICAIAECSEELVQEVRDCM